MPLLRSSLVSDTHALESLSGSEICLNGQDPHFLYRHYSINNTVDHQLSSGGSEFKLMIKKSGGLWGGFIKMTS